MDRAIGGKTQSGKAAKLRETGVRLYEDQIEKLDIIVMLGNGREDRSRLIREGIDNLIAQRLGNAVSALAGAHAAQQR
jgi:hypothetical protein